MHPAPAVSLRFGRSQAVAWPLSLLGGAASAAAAAWALGWGAGSAAIPAVTGMVAAVSAVAGAATGAWLARRLSPGQLRLEDGRWWWSASGQDGAVAVRLSVAVDLDNWLLLRCRTVDAGQRGAAPRWIALRRAAVLAGSWHAFRTAVYNARQDFAAPRVAET